MAQKELTIYSVVGCDLDFITNNGDVCVYRIELRTLNCEAELLDNSKFKVESEWGDEHIGTIQELMEIQEDGEEIFTVSDVSEEYIFDEGTHPEPPIDDDGYDVKWGSEEFFIEKEKAIEFYKEEIEGLKYLKHSAGVYANLIWYSSSPR